MAISGSGNVAIYAAEKAFESGAIVVTLSDSDGTIYDNKGLDRKKIEYVKELKEVRRGRIREFAEKFGYEYFEGENPWHIPCEVALPCATQNEIGEDDARNLLENGVRLVAEGANMPCTKEATSAFRDAGILYAPGKASNAGGVAVSGLEISQNALHMHWSAAEVDERLSNIMRDIHSKCKEYGDAGNGNINYSKGANIAAFLKLADAMLAQGPD